VEKMANWLDRLKGEIPQEAIRGTAISDERNLTAVTAVRKTDTSAPTVDLAIDDTVIAVLIDSAILSAAVWFAFSDDFQSGDDLPVFFASEMPFLRQMTEAELKRRYAEKRALGGGWIRDRIEPTEH
jgi:hypothetical protein